MLNWPKSTGSFCFTLLLSIGVITTSCNSGTAQNEKESEDKVEEVVDAHYQNIDVAKFDELRANNEYVLLDVRTPKEIAAGKVPDAVELDFFDPSFDTKLGQLAKDKEYLIYCKSGGRSSKAAQMMIDKGYHNVYNLNGGYTSWFAAHPDND